MTCTNCECAQSKEELEAKGVCLGDTCNCGHAYGFHHRQVATQPVKSKSKSRKLNVKEGKFREPAKSQQFKKTQEPSTALECSNDQEPSKAPDSSKDRGPSKVRESSFEFVVASKFVPPLFLASERAQHISRLSCEAEIVLQLITTRQQASIGTCREFHDGVFPRVKFEVDSEQVTFGVSKLSDNQATIYVHPLLLHFEEARVALRWTLVSEYLNVKDALSNNYFSPTHEPGKRFEQRLLKGLVSWDEVNGSYLEKIDQTTSDLPSKAYTLVDLPERPKQKRMKAFFQTVPKLSVS